MQNNELEAALARARRHDRVAKLGFQSVLSGVAVNIATWAAVARPHTFSSFVVWCAIGVPVYLLFAYLGSKVSRLFDTVDARRRRHYTSDSQDNH